MKRAACLLGFLMLWGAQLSQAQTLAPALRLVGSADYYELNKNFYTARLFASIDMPIDIDVLLSVAEPKRIEIEVRVERWSARRFAGQWLQAIAINNAPESVALFQSELNRFIDIATTTLAAGDVIRVETDTQTTAVILNDDLVFETAKPGFAELLMTTWIGARPPSSNFKHNILNGGETLTASLQ